MLNYLEIDMSNRLTGLNALVTGASKGIGAAIAQKLAAEGAAVAVNYSSDKEGAERVVAAITAMGGKAFPVQANLAEAKDIERLITQVSEAFGSLDILVNNAGVYEFMPLGDITPDHFHKQFNVNVLGLLLTTQGAARILKDVSSIVNISSGVTTLLPPGSAVYSATKASVDAITTILAKELGPRKIRVNSVNPGMILTEGVKTAGFDQGDMRAWVESITPLGRVGNPEEIAAVVAFLASTEASYINGTTVHASGGAS